QALALGLGLPAQEEIPQRREIALEADPAAPLLVARALEERLHGADELRRPAGVVAPDDIRVPDLLLAARRPRRQLRDELRQRGRRLERGKGQRQLPVERGAPRREARHERFENLSVDRG